MKLIAFNGSPKKEGNTYFAIKMVTDELEKKGIDVEIIQVGSKKIYGCTACGTCSKILNDRCIIDNDEVNLWIEKIKEADGVILGSPVYFSGINGTFKSFLDRAFYVLSRRPSVLRYKVGVAVVALRRSGGISAFHELNNYLLFSEMLIPTSNYWNVIHGRTPGEVLQDQEGEQIMRKLGKNIVWLMQVLEYSKNNIALPETEDKITTNFIR